MAELSKEEQDKLPDSDFAVPGKRLLPMHDREHAELAWRMMDRADGLTAEERAEARRRILARLRQFGVDVSNYKEADSEGGENSPNLQGESASERAVKGGLSGCRSSGTSESSGGASAALVEGRVFESVLHLCEAVEASVVPGEKAVEVTIIRPGLSANGHEYPENVLMASVPMWEGVAAFCDHPSWIDQTRAGGRSVRDLVGVYSEPRWENGVRAKLRFNGQGGWLYDLVCEAIRDREAGKVVAPIGISADMLVFRERMMDRWKVHQVRAVTSADIVFRPSAGGRFERILEGRKDLEVETTATTEAAGAAGTGGPSSGGTGAVSDAVAAELAAVREARLVLCSAMLDQKLATSGLPEAAASEVRERFKGRVFEASELDAQIASMQKVAAALAAPSVVQGMGVGRVQMGLSSKDRVLAALDRLFGLEVPDALKDVPKLSGIREAYVLITGDKGFRGRYNWEESVLREANEVTTGIMADALANVMNKRLVKDYQAQELWWRPIVVRSSLRDMKAQTRVLLNDFASLSTVAENGAYTNLAWGDNRETYTPTKRGNLVTVTLEMIMNDDLRSVARIPSKIASAAAVTLNEFVAALFTVNAGSGPAMSDTYFVFDDVNHQGNKAAAALSSGALQAGISVIMKMQNTAGKRLGIKPRYLLIPPDLLWTARTILESQLLPGTNNNDINVTRGVVEIVVVPQFTDVNNWYLMADPGVIECIEIGFLNGREEPELLVQDNPTDGSVFTNDAIAYKVRHIYGGGWLDYRGAYGSVPV